MTQRGLTIKSYVIGETIGEGSFGKVRLANHVETKSQVAVKVLLKAKVSEEQAKKEITIQSLLSHPNIIQLITSKTSPEAIFIFLELAPGGELFDRIEPEKGVDHLAAHFYFRQLISAVAHCHKRGISHRDIKPENMLLDRFGLLVAVTMLIRLSLTHRRQHQAD